MFRIRGVPLALILSAVLLGACGQSLWAQQSPRRSQSPPAAERPAAAAVEPLRTAVDRPIDIRDIRLELAVDLTKKIAEGTATLQFRTLRPIKHIELDAVEFKVKNVSLTDGNGEAKTVPYKHDGKKLTLLLDSPWSSEKKATLKIDYRVEKPNAGLHFFGPTAAEPDAPPIVWSQGEAITNRYWIPCIDEPDERQTTEIVVTVPEGYEAISNGKLLSRKENADSKTVTFDWKQDKPHPSYLVTLVVGQFDVVREEWDKVPVLYYVPRGKKNLVTHTFARTRDMLSFFSQRFGIRYPWDKYAQVVAFRFGGGMENTSATTMGDILQDERSLLDRDSDGIISHELAHQWWGDLVTCRDWAHIWLNEGFASFAEALWDEHKNGADAYAYNMFRKGESAIQGGKERPIVDRHYPNPRTMFDARAYPKGAWVLHMLRRRLGEETFWKGVQTYGQERRLQSAETSDFRRVLERVSGRNLERFFYDWTERPGSPVLEVATEYLPATRQAKVAVKQTQKGEPFHFPLTVRLACAGSDKPVTIEQDVTDREYTFLVSAPGALTQVEVDPEQTILGEIKESKSHDLWAAQLMNGPSAAVRLRAAQHFRDSKTEEDRELLAAALAKEKFWGVQSEIAATLGKMGGSKARDALLRGSAHADARVRSACLRGLGDIPADATVAEAALNVLRKGDPSYAVCGAAMTAYVKHKGKDAVAVLTPWLSRPSHYDSLCAGALAALSNTKDPAILDTLVKYAKPGHSRRSRAAALRGLTQLAADAKLDPKQSKQIAGVLTTALESDDQMMQFMVMAALDKGGPIAEAMLPALDKYSTGSADGRIRNRAKQLADRIRSQSKPDTAKVSAEMKQLREEVDRLKREQTDLRERLRKLEGGKSK